MFYLASNGEIRIAPLAEAMPEPHAHPLLLISLIGEVEERGLRIQTSQIVPSAQTEAASAVCVQTTARFLLWQSQSASQDARYCDCYERENAAAAWQLATTYSRACDTDRP